MDNPKTPAYTLSYLCPSTDKLVVLAHGDNPSELYSRVPEFLKDYPPEYIAKVHPLVTPSFTDSTLQENRKAPFIDCSSISNRSDFFSILLALEISGLVLSPILIAPYNVIGFLSCLVAFLITNQLFLKRWPFNQISK
jgi:hypothetical protein